jgi:enediyne biosynthesis thioesterase
VVDQLTRGFVLVTISCSCEYLSELYVLDEVSVRMSLADITANRVAMNFDYYRVNRGPAQLVARGTQTVACMSRQDRLLRPVELPSELAAALAAYASGSAPSAANPVSERERSIRG